MTQQPVNPQVATTDEEFAIQAMTIHGAFFERKCQYIITQAKNWFHPKRGVEKKERP